MRPALSLGILIAASAPSVLATEPEDAARAADEALNSEYQALIEHLSDGQEEALRDAQRAWISFRDRACAFESAFKSGELRDWIGQQTNPVLDRACVQRLTLERLSDLKRYSEYISRNSAPISTHAGAEMLGCHLPNLPADFTVEAVGVSRGEIETDVRLDLTGSDTKSVEVIANRPGESIVVVLMAYEPVLWQLKRTRATNVVAVLVGGYHGQAVLGLERSTPLLISTATGRKDCDQPFYAFKAGHELLRANAVVKRITGREIDHIWSNVTAGLVHIGEPPTRDADLVSSDDYVPEDFTTLPRFPPGKKGIARLIELGLLRLATAADHDAWTEKASAKYRKFSQTLRVSPLIGPQGSYVVLGKMTFPTGLYGGNFVSFFVPPGIPVPDGDPGHSPVYFLEDGSCRGSLCGVTE